MSKEIKNLGASVLDRLRNKAKDRNLPFQWLLYQYANERFLYRLSQSKYCDKFILKGGLIFNSWNLPIRRLTKDIDFLALTSTQIDEVVRILKEICAQSVQIDAVEYNTETISAEEILEQNNYPGVRVRFKAIIGEKTKVNMQVDIGFSDVITFEENTITYPTLLIMPAPVLKVYSKESVVAEKIHTIISRGSVNSRRRDFYDLQLISRRMRFDGKTLQIAIIQTFQNRATQIPSEIPAGLSDQFAVDNQKQWQAFLKTFNSDMGDWSDFKVVISNLRKFVLPILETSAKGLSFNLYWNAGGPWD